jgi:hypothetical protein
MLIFQLEMMSDFVDHDLQQVLERVTRSTTLIPPKIYEDRAWPTGLSKVLVKPGRT